VNIKKLLDFVFLVGYCILIYWLSSHKTLPMPHVFRFQDKILHAGAYFVMCLLAWRFLKDFFQSRKMQQWMPVIFCSLYGATDEWHQYFVPGRRSDVWDWLADTLGAGFAIWLLYQFYDRKPLKISVPEDRDF
jgi:VanZ family protein